MEKDYSLDALERFLDYASNKGLLKKNTAQSRKRAALKILDVLDDEEKRDLRQVDIEHTFERFSNLQGTEFKPASLMVFKSRLKSALTDFFAYTESPATFKPTGSQRTSSARKNNGKDSEQTPSKKVSEPSEKTETQEKQAESAPQTHLVIPIPLRDGLTVKIHNIPADLTKPESEKIAAIIRAYAMPEG